MLHRYRNLSVLLVVLCAQLMLLAYQIRTDEDVRLIRVWAVEGVTPLARLLEGIRSGVSGFFDDYFVLLDVRQDNERLSSERDRLLLENQYLRAELETAERASALAIFQQQSPMKTVAAHIISNTTGPGGRVVIADRGASSGVERGMGVITPQGIAGKIVDVYPNASFVLLATDPSFAAGVVSQNHHVHGTLKGQGSDTVTVDYIQNEMPVEPGEWFYTSGDDRIFPRGIPAGVVTMVRPGREQKEVTVTPAGFASGIEEVLIIVEGVHLPLPTGPVAGEPMRLQPVPDAGPASASAVSPAQSGPVATDADRIAERVRRIGEAQQHVFGERGTGAPDFNIDPDEVRFEPSPAPSGETPPPIP